MSRQINQIQDDDNDQQTKQINQGVRDEDDRQNSFGRIQCRNRKNRLRTGIGIIEFERTKEILEEKLPKAPAVIYDIGGGYGEYAWWLASLGYEVHLFDISKTNIKMSEVLKHEYPNVHLESAEVCDARSIPRKSKSADAVLLMGPLYSITEYEERILAISNERILLI